MQNRGMRAVSLGEHPETSPLNLDNLMDLSTSYPGMNLRTPLVPSASPLSRNIDDLKRLEDAGAPAVVFHSIFEEQLQASSKTADLRMGPELYLDHISRAKDNVSMPIIDSLNAAAPGGWVSYARQVEQAGANALELNIYNIPTDMDRSGSEVEQVCIDLLKAVKSEITIPIAVKLSPFFSNMANMARRFDDARADALVLFNRFYQPDIDLGKLDVALTPTLSVPKGMLLPLRWVGILHGRIRANLAASGGIHRGSDAIKMLLAGADVTMLCSVLLRHGIEDIGVLERELRQWLERNRHESIAEIKGLVSYRNCSNPSAFERAHYARALDSYDPLFLMAGKPHFG
jgi:dihydroorotate dehydrogenase (fumarate)